MQTWVLLAALLIGSQSMSFYWPSQQILNLIQEAQDLRGCLNGKGLVASHLIGQVPSDHIWSDRVPRTDAQWEKLDFVFFSPRVERYELNLREAARLFEKLSADTLTWRRVGKGCQVGAGYSDQDQVVLFQRIQSRAH